VSYLLDTNFISEAFKPRPDRQIIGWMRTSDQTDQFLSVMTFGELRRGAELLESGRRRRQLEIWIETELTDYFEDRILSISREVAGQFGRLGAESRRKGWGLEAVDALIAATAQVHDLTLATLNRKHFEKLGVKLLSL
jgi:predicted nucleic acid-binding protein